MALLTSEQLTVKQTGTVVVVQQVPAWAWRCEKCGWLGTGHTTELAAMREGSDHLWDDHAIAVCGPAESEKWGHPGHRWERRPPADAEQCGRCGLWCGK